MKLTHLRRLRLSNIPDLILAKHFYVQLSQFRSLTGLLLHGITVGDFLHIAKVVVSCRSLK